MMVIAARLAMQQEAHEEQPFKRPGSHAKCQLVPVDWERSDAESHTGL
jgi:hypothetical protein